MFNKKRNEDGHCVYYDTYEKSIISFCEYYNTSKHNPIIYFGVSFVVQHKRKKYPYLKQTGDGTLTYLLWAKNKLIEFESFIKNKHINKKIKIWIQGDDNRRKKIYYRSLSKIGYSYERIYNVLVLVKTLN